MFLIYLSILGYYILLMPPTVPVLITDSHRIEKLVLENVSDIIITTDLQFIIQSWNKIAEKFYGLPATTAIGRRINDVITFQYNNTTAEEAILNLEQHKIWRGEVSFTNKAGETYYFLQTVKYILDSEGTEAGILAVGRNITERKKAEEQLEQSEEFYRTLIADSLDTTLLLNAAGDITFVTPSIEPLLGFQPAEILHTNAFQYVHPDDLAWALQSFEREIDGNPEIKFIVVRLQKKDGHWVWCMVRGHNLLRASSIHSIVIYIHDDTLRKEASDALKESEKRFRTLVRDLGIGVLLQKADGAIEMTNAAMCRLFDIEEADIVGGKIWELYSDVIHEDGAPFLQSERPSFSVKQTGQAAKDVVMGVWHPKRNERVWLLVCADPMTDENGRLLNIICSFTDITERKKWEKKILQQQLTHQRQLSQATLDGQEKERMDIGKDLHDNIGQQLTTIKLFLDLAKTSSTPENADMIAMAVKGITDVINEVRAISRSLVPPSLTDLGFIDSVNDLIDSLRSTQALTIELDYFEFDEDLLPENKRLALFRIIQEQLNNVIKHAGAKRVAITLRWTEDGILLQIEDDGKGFTKADGRKGLGLKNITNRAELFGGRAEIITSPGAGCLLRIWLPHKFIPAVF